MIIEETEAKYAIEVYEPSCGGLGLAQGADLLLIDKKQAVQLIAELRRWVDGGEIE